jgi:4-diphosphocytidyl-2-C-methyl-D-erythritol kinase
MADLVMRAPAKINLHLEVLGLRSDGFHELAMVMQTIDLADSLAMRPTADGRITLSCAGADLPTDSGNLIVRAGLLLRQRAGLPELGAHISLIKRIPIGAGLAGGSSNGAAALVGLQTLWGLGFSPQQLEAMAAELGSDMPFCLAGGTQLCFGRGEVLEPLQLPQAGELGVLLIKHPQASVSTPWAYGRCRDQRQHTYLQGETAFAQRRQSLRTAPLLAALAGDAPWPPLRNDLQAVVEPEVASVAAGLTLLRRAPAALAVAMSGSGPSLFALFADRPAAEAAARQLAEPLAAEGFDAWVCGCSRRGVSLESDGLS